MAKSINMFHNISDYGGAPTENPRQYGGKGCTCNDSPDDLSSAPNENPFAFESKSIKRPGKTKQIRSWLFKRGKGLDFTGVNQYGGSSNNENPFQVN